MQNAIVYARFSPRRLLAGDAERLAAQEDLASMQLQVETDLKYAEFHKLNVIDVLKEPFTSARATPLFERPEGSKLRDLPPGTHIICMKLARMFRNVDDGRATMRHFEDRGVTLHFADEGGVSLNVSTAKGKLVATLLLAVTEYEPEETAERTSKGMLHRQRNGQRMTSRKTIPYGTMLDPHNDANIVACHQELQAAREARNLREKGWSLRDIAAAIGPIRGKNLHPQGVKDLINITQHGVLTCS